MTELLGIPIIPIRTKKGTALPIIGACVLIVVVLVAGAMLANRRARKKRDRDKRDL
jgi:hypothetical protein